MKFFVLFAFLFALSCSIPDQQNSEMEGVDLDAISGSRKAGQIRRVSIAKNENERKRKRSSLRDEEVSLTRYRRREQRRFLGFASANKKNISTVHTICRRFDGCQKFCTDWRNQNTDCNQWTVSTVAEEWSSLLDSLSTEQLIENVQWVAMHQDVSAFLREADFEQNIMGKIISRLSQENCAFSEGLDIYHSVNTNEVSLYLEHPEGQEQGLKKITDFDVDINIFKGSVNKCLNDKQFSLPELMLAHQNTLGFQLMHQRIADSCNHREECIQLAYCKINSEQVWSHLEQVKYSDDFNIEVQAEKCSYEDFNSLPSI